MTPIVLGNLTALAQKTQGAQQAAQQAAQRALNAQNTANANATAIAALQGKGGASQVSTGVPLITSGAAIAWSPQPLGTFLPSAAKWVLLTGYAYFSTPDNADVELDFRSGPSGGTIVACRFRSVLGNYSGESAINCWVPIGDDGSIQYTIVNGSFTTLQVSVAGYM
jgi:hypothetical protein